MNLPETSFLEFCYFHPASTGTDPYYIPDDLDIPYIKIIAPFDNDFIDENYPFLVGAWNIHRLEFYDNDSLVKSIIVSDTYNEYTLILDSRIETHYLEFRGFDEHNDLIASSSIKINVMPGIDLSRGMIVGDMWISYYYIGEEARFRGEKDIFITDMQCIPLAEVNWDFLAELCMEGSGRLNDGSILNYGSRCKCGFPCPWGGNICYVELDKVKYPWGAGSRKKSLVPLRTLAVDNNVIPHGTIVYIEEWDGVAIPDIGGIGNFIHDGCFRADDIGGWIKNDHFDFFSGTKEMWLYFEKIIPTKKRMTVRIDAGRCSYLKND